MAGSITSRQIKAKYAGPVKSYMTTRMFQGGGKWMQAASERMERKGTKGATTRACKNMGHKGVTDECLSKLSKRGGVWKKRVSFARTARKIAKK